MLLTNVAGSDKQIQAAGKVAEYLGNKIPALIDFAIGVVLALLVFFIGAKVIKWIRKLIQKSMKKGNVDEGVCQFVDSFAKFTLYAILIFSIGSKFGLDTTSVAAALASCGVAIGLALQGSLSNFAGGVLILILKPFVVGDYIVEDNKGREGTVKEIQLFYTKLLTIDNRTVVIPNGTLANTSLINVTTQKKRNLDLRVGISYEADLKKAKEVLEKLLTEDASVIQDEEINVFVDELGSSSVVLGIRAWVPTEDYWTARWRVLEDAKLLLDANGVEIPYQQITVHMGK